MITDENVLLTKQYVDQYWVDKKRNSDKLNFIISVYNFNHKDKLKRKKCGCDYDDKFREVSIWLSKCFKENRVINYNV